MLTKTNINEKSIAGKKVCPFCGESIQAAAIKCRFCSEWLESPVRNAPHSYSENVAGIKPKDSIAQAATADGNDEDLFEGRSSYAAMLGSFVLSALLTITAITIAAWPMKSADSETQSIKTVIGITMLLLTAFWILCKMAILKSTFYRLTPDRLEYHRGILGRKVDNIDLFRIVDYKMERSILDRILGIGTIKLFSSDKTDPEFLIYKVKKPQNVFDILGKSTFAADRKANIIHVE
jgi:membrane protein YdbS with pleckstrin-like domain